MNIKRLLFWSTIPLTFLVAMVCAMIGSVGMLITASAELGMEALHKWEAWTGDYAKDHTYLGGGIWTDKKL